MNYSYDERIHLGVKTNILLLVINVTCVPNLIAGGPLLQNSFLPHDMNMTC